MLEKQNGDNATLVNEDEELKGKRRVDSRQELINQGSRMRTLGNDRRFCL